MLKKLARNIAALLGGSRGSRGSRGESLTEVLVSVLVGGLALLMLAMAITTSSHVAVNSRQHMGEYYTANNNAITAASSAVVGSGTAALKESGVSVPLVSGDSVAVQYQQNEQLESTEVISYTETVGP